MNVLVICREIPPVGGGAGHVAIHLAEEVAKAGHGVDIVTMHYGDLPRREKRGPIRIHRVACGRRNQDSSYLLEMGRFVLAARPIIDRLVVEKTFDVIHAHAIIPDGWMGTRPARRWGIPLVITAHGSDVPGYNPDKFGFAHKLMRPIWKRTLNRAAVVVTPSQHLANMIRAALPADNSDARSRPGEPPGNGASEEVARDLPPSPGSGETSRARAGAARMSAPTLRVIPNGIRPDLFAPAAKDGSFLIVSRLVRRKNYHLFLEALRAIEAPQTVHVVGIGPALDELKALAAGLPQHRVVFHGWLENGSEKWRSLYEKCRYFVFPSESENFPINLLEAQLAGMTVLASDIPGAREVLGDEAVYFPASDAASVARTVRAVLAGEIPGLATLGARARGRVRDHFSWADVAGRYLNLYSAILESRA
ncbi:MAG: glycosyltransferase family 4 protein [Verrucomicrobia bacterium]|nr:glycosyltransferase family 4 protein [Verrucomicrobiota bacterium]